MTANPILNDLVVATDLYSLVQSRTTEAGAMHAELVRTTEAALIACAKAVVDALDKQSPQVEATPAKRQRKSQQPADPAPAPIEAETPTPAEIEATAPIEDETPTPAEAEAAAPIEDDTPSVVEASVDTPVETAEAEAAAPVEEETPASAQRDYASEDPEVLREFIGGRVKDFVKAKRIDVMRRALAAVECSQLREVPDAALAALAQHIEVLTAELAAAGEVI